MWGDMELICMGWKKPVSGRTFHLLHAPQGILQGRQCAGSALGLLVCGEVDLQLLERSDQFFVCICFGRLLTAVE